MFEHAELRGTPMGPNDPPTAKGTAYLSSKQTEKGKQATFWSLRSF